MSSFKQIPTIYNFDKLIEDYKEVAFKLAYGPWNALKIEKLQGRDDIFSVRVNKKYRLTMLSFKDASGKASWLYLGMHKHRYKQDSYVRGKKQIEVNKLIEHYSGKAIDVAQFSNAELWEEFSGVANERLIKPEGNRREPEVLYCLGNYFSLTPSQQEAYDQRGKLLLLGPGGCGKTTVGSLRLAMHAFKLKQLIEEGYFKEHSRLVFIASKEVIAEMKALCDTSPSFRKIRKLIVFYTYEDYALLLNKKTLIRYHLEEASDTVRAESMADDRLYIRINADKKTFSYQLKNLDKTRTLYQLPDFPKHPLAYKNSFVFIKKENRKELYYIANNGEVENVPIVNMTLFTKQLTDLKKDKETKLDLNEAQIHELIHLNGGYTLKTEVFSAEINPYKELKHFAQNKHLPLTLAELKKAEREIIALAKKNQHLSPTHWQIVRKEDSFSPWLRKYISKHKQKLQEKTNLTLAQLEALRDVPGVVYKEFRILSGFTQLNEYLDYANQPHRSKFSGQPIYQTLLFDLFVSYQAYLASRQECILELYRWPDDVTNAAISADTPGETLSCGGFFLDESQDLPTLALRNLNCCLHPFLTAEGKKDYLGTMAAGGFQNLEGKISNIDYIQFVLEYAHHSMQETHRCSLELTRVLNRLIAAKLSINTGGDYDGEFVRVLPAKTMAHVPGKVSFYPNLNPDAFRRLAELVKGDARCIIITTTEQLDEMRAIFGYEQVTDLISAKGLEFEIGILVNILPYGKDVKKIKQANDHLSNPNAIKEPKKPHLPKKGTPNSDIDEVLNNLYVGISRCRERVVLLGIVEHGNQHLANYLFGPYKRDVFDEDFKHSTRDEWEARLISNFQPKAINPVLYEASLSIFVNQLGGTKEDFERYLREKGLCQDHGSKETAVVHGQGDEQPLVEASSEQTPDTAAPSLQENPLEKMVQLIKEMAETTIDKKLHAQAADLTGTLSADRWKKLTANLNHPRDLFILLTCCYLPRTQKRKEGVGLKLILAEEQKAQVFARFLQENPSFGVFFYSDFILQSWSAKDAESKQRATLLPIECILRSKAGIPLVKIIQAEQELSLLPLKATLWDEKIEKRVKTNGWHSLNDQDLLGYLINHKHPVLCEFLLHHLEKMHHLEKNSPDLLFYPDKNGMTLFGHWVTTANSAMVAAFVKRLDHDSIHKEFSSRYKTTNGSGKKVAEEWVKSYLDDKKAPANKKEDWKTIANTLFKARETLNIEGIIDPVTLFNKFSVDELKIAFFGKEDASSPEAIEKAAQQLLTIFFHTKLTVDYQGRARKTKDNSFITHVLENDEKTQIFLTFGRSYPQLMKALNFTSLMKNQEPSLPDTKRLFWLGHWARLKNGVDFLHVLFSEEINNLSLKEEISKSYSIFYNESVIKSNQWESICQSKLVQVLLVAILGNQSPHMSAVFNVILSLLNKKSGQNILHLKDAAGMTLLDYMITMSQITSVEAICASDHCDLALLNLEKNAKKLDSKEIIEKNLKKGETIINGIKIMRVYLAIMAKYNALMLGHAPVKSEVKTSPSNHSQQFFPVTSKNKEMSVDKHYRILTTQEERKLEEWAKQIIIHSFTVKTLQAAFKDLKDDPYLLFHLLFTTFIHLKNSKYDVGIMYLVLSEHPVLEENGLIPSDNNTIVYGVLKEFFSVNEKAREAISPEFICQAWKIRFANIEFTPLNWFIDFNYGPEFLIIILNYFTDFRERVDLRSLFHLEDIEKTTWADLNKQDHFLLRMMKASADIKGDLLGAFLDKGLYEMLFAADFIKGENKVLRDKNGDTLLDYCLAEGDKHSVNDIVNNYQFDVKLIQDANGSTASFNQRRSDVAKIDLDTMAKTWEERKKIKHQAEAYHHISVRLQEEDEAKYIFNLFGEDVLKDKVLMKNTKLNKLSKNRIHTLTSRFTYKFIHNKISNRRDGFSQKDFHPSLISCVLNDEEKTKTLIKFLSSYPAFLDEINHNNSPLFIIYLQRIIYPSFGPLFAGNETIFSQMKKLWLAMGPVIFNRKAFNNLSWEEIKEEQSLFIYLLNRAKKNQRTAQESAIIQLFNCLLKGEGDKVILSHVLTWTDKNGDGIIEHVVNIGYIGLLNFLSSNPALLNVVQQRLERDFLHSLQYFILKQFIKNETATPVKKAESNELDLVLLWLGKISKIFAANKASKFAESRMKIVSNTLALFEELDKRNLWSAESNPQLMRIIVDLKESIPSNSSITELGLFAFVDKKPERVVSLDNGQPPGL